MKILHRFIFIIFYFICFKKSFQTYIKYSFRKSKKEEKIYPENILQNDLEVTIEIGTPPQKIDVNLRSQEYTFFITSSTVNLPYKTFDKSKSSSFIRTINFTSNFSQSEYKQGYSINETITINNKEYKNISLIFATLLSYNESGALGLRLVSSRQYGDDLSFIYQIKKSAKLDNYSFFLQYNENDDEKGELIIGSYPHIYDSKKYKENDFYYTETGVIRNTINWVLNFYSINYDNNIIFDATITKSLIKIDFGLIQAPFKLKDYFLKNVLLGQCNQKFYSERKIYMISCEKSFNFSNFKNLSFIHKEFEYEFILTYKDLFIENDDKYLFGIVFDNIIDEDNDKSYWILGKIFMKKYQLFFDLDKKIIGLYKTINKEDDDENDDDDGDDEKKNKFNSIYIIVIILALIVIGLIAFFVYLLKKKRKNLANELSDENFDYIPSN